MSRWVLAVVALAVALAALWHWTGGRRGAPAAEASSEPIAGDARSPRAIGPGSRALVEPAVTPAAAPGQAEPSEPAPPPEDEPPEDFEDAPPDPIELGPAALDLRLVDAATGEGVRSHVELWRIDAPGNDGWSAGDQLQAEAEVPAEGRLFTRLPEGRYRVVAAAAAWCAPLPEVEVAAPRTLLDVPLALPRPFRVRLSVRARDGGLVDELRLGPTGSASFPQEAWRWERQPRRGLRILEDHALFSSGPDPWPSLGPQPADGFDLGLQEDAARGSGGRTVLVLRTRDGASVRVPLPACAPGEVHMVATVLPPRDVLARVVWPAGLEPPEVTTEAEAVPCPGGVPGAAWERAPVRIRATAPGCAPAEATWTAADGDVPRLELARRR